MLRLTSVLGIPSCYFKSSRKAPWNPERRGTRHPEAQQRTGHPHSERDICRARPIDQSFDLLRGVVFTFRPRLARRERIEHLSASPLIAVALDRGGPRVFSRSLRRRTLLQTFGGLRYPDLGPDVPDFCFVVQETGAKLRIWCSAVPQRFSAAQAPGQKSTAASTIKEPTAPYFRCRAVQRLWGPLRVHPRLSPAPPRPRRTLGTDAAERRLR